MQTLTEIRQLLEAHGVRPKHRFGQNFLHDKNQLTKLLDAADVKAGDVILEVGPGTGTLTSALLERRAQIIACEIDDGMAQIIEEEYGDAIGRENDGRSVQNDSLHLIRGDALEKGRRLNPEIINAVGDRRFKLVANLPYQIASPLISALLMDHSNCTGQFVTIQKEVADRLVASPGAKDCGPLSIIVQALATVKRIGTLSPSCFWPEPEVTSAMVAIEPFTADPGMAGRGDRVGLSSDRREFARFITAVFSKRRKQLGTILGRRQITWPSGVTADMRPEALTVSQHLDLWRAVKAIDPATRI